ncbi:hypothetical protein [Agromyces sp. H66]|nr:hypothetical protein [Agromyces sp. H66]
MSNPDPIVSPDDGTEEGAATDPDRPREDGLPRDPDATEHLDVDITDAGE